MRRFIRINVRMTMISQLLAVSGAYCRAVGLSEARVSTIVFNRGARLAELRGGSDLATGSWEKAMAWFSANWPAGSPWPEGIERPPGAIPAAAEADDRRIAPVVEAAE